MSTDFDETLAALSNRRRGFREKCGLAPWTGREGPRTKAIRERLTHEQRDKDTTKVCYPARSRLFWSPSSLINVINRNCCGRHWTRPLWTQSE